jgi:hypothetical protein
MGEILVIQALLDDADTFIMTITLRLSFGDDDLTLMARLP